MQARGPLMIEHRLIERMLSIVREALVSIESSKNIDPFFVDTIVDFIRVYADRTHHGKEEDILFRELEKKSMSVQDRQIMEDLVKEHASARRSTEALVDANNRYRNGETAALADIAATLRFLIEFYPEHIRKEDKVFFPSSRAYFTPAEDQAILAEFFEFDRQMIHEKYLAVVADLDTRK